MHTLQRALRSCVCLPVQHFLCLCEQVHAFRLHQGGGDQEEKPARVCVFAERAHLALDLQQSSNKWGGAGKDSAGGHFCGEGNHHAMHI